MIQTQTEFIQRLVLLNQNWNLLAEQLLPWVVISESSDVLWSASQPEAKSRDLPFLTEKANRLNTEEAEQYAFQT